VISYCNWFDDADTPVFKNPLDRLGRSLCIATRALKKWSVSGACGISIPFFSTLIQEMALSYNHVCLSAGGLKFAAHLGALQFIHNIKMDPKSYAASSAGAAVAALVVAGHSPHDIHAISKRMPLSMFKNKTLIGQLKRPLGGDCSNRLAKRKSANSYTQRFAKATATLHFDNCVKPQAKGFLYHR
jgi:hypothetical protein